MISHYQESTTVFLFSAVYALLNIPVFVYHVVMVIEFSTGWEVKLLDFDHPNYYFFTFVELVVVSLNSAANPVVYLARMTELRSFMKEQYIGRMKRAADRWVSHGSDRDMGFRSGTRSTSAAAAAGTGESSNNYVASSRL